jgi:alginate O-acetyltransferase complex protein AlgJ
MRNVISVIFVLLIALPLAATVAGVDGADPGAENRAMAPFPASPSGWQSLSTYGADLSRWFDDHFAFRSALVRWHGESRLFWLGASPSTSVIVGRNGWLFYADDSAVEDYVSAKPFTPAELDEWRRTLEHARTALSARGAAFVFTVAPDKHAVYPEQMPASLRQAGPATRTQQLLEYLAAKSDVPAVDLRSVLLDAKRRERVYHMTDTHWNERGVFAAYQRIIDAVRRQVPAVPAAWTRDDFDERSREVNGLDLAGMIGLTRVLHETVLELVPRRARSARVVEPNGVPVTSEEGRLVTEIPGSTLPRAVVIRDSFASALAPFLSEHFSRVVYLWQNFVDAKTIDEERPQVVIQEIVGRHLQAVSPYDEFDDAH